MSVFIAEHLKQTATSMKNILLTAKMAMSIVAVLNKSSGVVKEDGKLNSNKPREVDIIIRRALSRLKKKYES